MMLLDVPDYVTQSIPPNYFGRWRFTSQSIFDDERGKKRDIFSIKWDMYDTN